MVEQQLVLFDYASLDVETRVVVQQRTTEIKTLMKRAAQDIIEIGQKLIEVKERLGHGFFRKWVDAEFEGSYELTVKMMQVGGKLKSVTVTDLGIGAKALYLLCAPSTPGLALVEAIERDQSGETISYSTAQNIVDYHKETDSGSSIHSFNDWIDDPNPPYEIEEDLPDPAPVPAPYRPQSMTLLTSSLNDSWRTPSKYIEAARLVLGGIDLDPASSGIANETVKATKYYTKAEDGLDNDWKGTVWINPPYGKTNNQSNQGLFAHKLVNEYIEGNITAGIILINLYAGYGWFAPLRELHRCELDHRISFINPSTDEEGDEAKASSVFIYLGPKPELFYKEFSQFGVCGQLKYYK